MESWRIGLMDDRIDGYILSIRIRPLAPSPDLPFDSSWVLPLAPSPDRPFDPSWIRPVSRSPIRFFVDSLSSMKIHSII